MKYTIFRTITTHIASCSHNIILKILFNMLNFIRLCVYIFLKNIYFQKTSIPTYKSLRISLPRLQAKTLVYSKLHLNESPFYCPVLDSNWSESDNRSGVIFSFSFSCHCQKKEKKEKRKWRKGCVRFGNNWELDRGDHDLDFSLRGQTFYMKLHTEPNFLSLWPKAGPRLETL